MASSFTSAMMDVSDGLLLDIQRMAEASDVTVKLFLKKIPPRTSYLSIKNIVSDGEDYELIFTVKPPMEKKLLYEWPFGNIKLTRIGKVMPFQGNHVVDEDSKNLFEKFTSIGYDHFVKKN